MRLYLDLCAIQRPLDDQSQLRVRTETEAVLSILTLVESGTLNLVVSGAHIVENAKCPYPDRRTHTDDVLALAAAYVPISDEILRRAEKYVQGGTKKLDALHLASAVEVRTDFFCTTDDQLMRRGREVNTGRTVVVSPLELVLQLS